MCPVNITGILPGALVSSFQSCAGVVNVSSGGPLEAVNLATIGRPWTCNFDGLAFLGNNFDITFPPGTTAFSVELSTKTENVSQDAVFLVGQYATGGGTIGSFGFGNQYISQIYISNTYVCLD